jgi:hypothetical protein
MTSLNSGRPYDSEQDAAAAATGPTPQALTAADLLTVLHAGYARWVGATIDPKGGAPAPQGFPHEALADWLRINSGRLNCYLYPAMWSPGISITKKFSKTDMVASNVLWVDCDPEGGDRFESSRNEILTRLRDHSPGPSCIVDTGNGYQAYWFLKNPESDLGAIESRNKGLRAGPGNLHRTISGVSA